MLKHTMLNMRSARRSHTIRNESDPAEVAKQLESILFEAINIQNADDRGFQLRALKELKQLRADMVAGQINAGSSGHKFVGLYSHVIDQLDNLTNTTNKSNNVLAKTADSFSRSLPSTDSLVAALMTANPIVGYGVKVIRDISKSRKEANSRSRDEAKRKLSVLKSEEEYIKSQIEQQEAESKNTEEKEKQVKREKREYKRGGIYAPLLTEIRDEIKRLESFLNQTNDEISDSNVLIAKNLEAVNDSIIDQTETLEKIEKSNDRDEKLSKMSESKDKGIPIIDEVATLGQQEKKGGILDTLLSGLLGMPLRVMTGAVAGFMGLLTGIMSIGSLAAAGGLIGGLIKGASSLVSFVLNLGKGLLRIGLKSLALPATVLAAIYGLFDGFFNADKIIGKADSEISLGERITAAVSNAFATVAKLVDWITNLFGFDLFDSEGLEKKIYNFVVSIPDKVTMVLDYVKQLFDTMLDQVIYTYDNLVEDVTSFYDEVIKSAKTVFNDAIDSVLSVFDKVTNSFRAVYDAIENKIKDWGRTLSSIPGIGGLFKFDGDDVKIDDNVAKKATSDLNSASSTLNLLRVGDGVATMTPLVTNSQVTGEVIQQAERNASNKNKSNNNTVVNAPTNVNNSATTVQTGSNTSNPNRLYERMSRGYRDYMPR